MRRYFKFGFTPKEFQKVSFPQSANSSLLAKWFNEHRQELKEAKELGISSGSVSQYLKEDRDISAKEVSNAKWNSRDIPLFLTLARDCVDDYRKEVILRGENYAELRNIIDKLADLGDFLHTSVSGPERLVTEALRFSDIRSMAYGHRLEVKFLEGFGHYDIIRKENEGEIRGYFEIEYKDGKFEFPVKRDPLCWNGHERINSGWTRKSHARLKMAGAGRRTVRMGELTAKYLNQISGLNTLLDSLKNSLK